VSTLSTLKPYTKLPFGGVVLPQFTVTPEFRVHYGAKSDCTNLELITQLCRNGYKQKVVSHVPKDQQARYAAQVKDELKIINELGFIDYILMVWDICRFADEGEFGQAAGTWTPIPRGPGRGSVGSSLVAYLIGITELDPIRNELFFTRFLSKARAKSTVIDGIRYIDGSLVPDIDCDFSYHRRGEVIEYLNRRYPGQTSKLLTTTTFTSKILIKDVLKTYLGANEQEAIDVSDLIEKEYGVPVEIEDSLNGNGDWRESKGEKGTAPNERFVKWSQARPENMDVCEIGMSLSGLNRGEGQHASAVLISAGPIRDLMPLQLSPDKDLVSGFDMYSAQEISIKMDILGLRTLDVIDEACRLLKIRRQDINVEDPSIYAYLQDFKHRYGIFQLETFAQGNAAVKVKPQNFEQLSAVLAIARPGAFAYLQQYCDYLHEGKYTSVHPLVDDILKPTGGVCLFQEQYLAMLRKVGMSDERAENARRVLGKKKKEEVPAVIEEITEACKKNGHPEELVSLLVKIAYDSGGYSFNKSHSAAYAMLTAYTIWLKANHPLEFFYALLKMARHESDSHTVLQNIEKEMRAMGFKLLPPHLTKSELDFTIVDEKSIRFALGLIRGISDANMSKLKDFVAKNAAALDGKCSYTVSKFELFQAIKNAGLNIGIACALIQAGCMEGYDEYTNENGEPYHSRSRLVLEACTWNQLSDTVKKLCLAVGERPEVRWDVIAAIKYLSKQTNDKGKPLIREVTLNSLRKKYKPYAEIYEMNCRNERLANYFYEKTVLGYSYSETLASIFGEQIDGLITTAEALAQPEGEKVRVIGFVADFLKGKTKKGNDEIKFRLLDETGELRVKAFNDKIERIETDNKRLPIENDICIVSGRKMSADTLFVEQLNPLTPSLVAIQTVRIYMRLNDLRDAPRRSTHDESGQPSAPSSGQNT
jgi:DNA polymerase III alpha subunit